MLKIACIFSLFATHIAYLIYNTHTLQVYHANHYEYLVSHERSVCFGWDGLVSTFFVSIFQFGAFFGRLTHLEWFMLWIPFIIFGWLWFKPAIEILKNHPIHFYKRPIPIVHHMYFYVHKSLKVVPMTMRRPLVPW